MEKNHEFTVHPGRLTWNLQINTNHTFRKENDLNQTSMRTCSMLIFLGVARFDRIPVEERGSVEFFDCGNFPKICTPYWYPICFSCLCKWMGMLISSHFAFGMIWFITQLIAATY